MQGVRNLSVNLTDLAWLFHTSPDRIRQWNHQGLPVNVDGSFTLSAVCRWREDRHRSELARKLTASSLSQKDLVRLLGVSRQSLTAWTKAGLPRRRDGRYDLKAACRWLPSHYRKTYERKYAERLTAIETKLHRNLIQCQRFVTGGRK